MNTRAGRNESGGSFIETILAVAVLGVTAVAALGALSAGARAKTVLDTDVTAHVAAADVMEYVKSSPYALAPTTYPAGGIPAGYAATVTAEAIPDRPGGDLQLITVTVTRGGVVRVVLKGYKANR